MKLIKPGILAAATVCGLMLCGTISNAQTDPVLKSTNAAPTTPGGAGAGAGRARAQALQAAFDKLDLNADQKTKVAAAVKEQREKQTELRADTSLSPQDKRTKNKEITDAFDAKLKTIFTADQYTKWQESKPAPRAGGRQGGAGAAGAGRPAKTPPPTQN